MKEGGVVDRDLQFKRALIQNRLNRVRVCTYKNIIQCNSKVYCLCLSYKDLDMSP